MTVSAPIKGEQVPHVEPIPEVPEHEEVDQHTEPTTTANAPVDHLGSNFKSPDPQPQLCCVEYNQSIDICLLAYISLGAQIQ